MDFELENSAAHKLNELKKKLNADSWNEHMEDLLKSWGEKSAGLRFIHSKAATDWRTLSNKLTFWGILITTVSSTSALTSTSAPPDVIAPLLFVVGGVGMVGAFIQSIKKFYNAEEKAAEHSAIAKQFGSFYRYLSLQLGMTRADRVPSDELASWALKEFERLQQDSPPLGEGPINFFKDTFDKTKQSFPDAAEDSFVINVFKSSELSVKPLSQAEFSEP